MSEPGFTEEQEERIKGLSMQALPEPIALTVDLTDFTDFVRAGFDTLALFGGPETFQWAAGYTRGDNNDLVCWSKELPPNCCLSPIAPTPGEAIRQAVVIRASVGDSPSKESRSC